MPTATEQEKDTDERYLATLGSPNQLLQLACCNQASLKTAAKPSSKAAARQVWVPADKGNKLKEEDASASASANAAAPAKDTEQKVADTVNDESRKL